MAQGTPEEVAKSKRSRTAPFLKRTTEEQMTSPFFLPTLTDGEDKSSPFVNCIRKNYRHIRKWAKRTHTNAFRIYDRHMHHYPMAIDYYDGKFCIQYFLPSPR